MLRLLYHSKFVTMQRRLVLCIYIPLQPLPCPFETFPAVIVNNFIVKFGTVMIPRNNESAMRLLKKPEIRSTIVYLRI